MARMQVKADGIAWRVRFVVLFSLVASIFVAASYLKAEGMLQNVIEWQIGRAAASAPLAAASGIFAKQLLYYKAVQGIAGGAQLLSRTASTATLIFICSLCVAVIFSTSMLMIQVRRRKLRNV